MEKSRKDAISWDECFMRIANVIAQRSKDPSTQSGAAVVDENNIVVGLGYNGFPRGIDNNEFPWDRKGGFLDVKYTYVCHAEENSIYNANTSTNNCKIFCTLFPCNECTKTIIQNGIKEIIYESDKYHDTDICIASRRMLDAAGIKYRQYVSEYNSQAL